MVNEILDNETLNIYPNPANNKIKINFKNQQGLSKVSILNIAGQTLVKEQINLKGESEINIENIPPGMYFMLLQDEKQQWVRKFVKQ